jgi:hypothetical protein
MRDERRRPPTTALPADFNATTQRRNEREALPWYLLYPGGIVSRRRPGPRPLPLPLDPGRRRGTGTPASAKRSIGPGVATLAPGGRAQRRSLPGTFAPSRLRVKKMSSHRASDHPPEPRRSATPTPAHPEPKPSPPKAGEGQLHVSSVPLLYHNSVTLSNQTTRSGKSYFPARSAADFRRWGATLLAQQILFPRTQENFSPPAGPCSPAKAGAQRLGARP